MLLIHHYQYLLDILIVYIDFFISTPYNSCMQKKNRAVPSQIFWTLIAFLTLGSCSYRPLFSPDDINPGVSIIETRRIIEMTPSSGTATAGLLFYPGGLVDSHVYNQLLADFSARSGATVVIVKMPANLAVFDIDAGLSIISGYPEITDWIIAGHSLGGSMAANTVKNHPDVYKALIFMDSYPADGDSLKEWPGNVLSLYSSVEKVNDPERMQQTIDLIPPATWLTTDNRTYPAADSNYAVIHQIDGGSHSYFGTYGPQDGDYTPTISRADFHAEVVDYMLEFFAANN